MLTLGRRGFERIVLWKDSGERIWLQVVEIRSDKTRIGIDASDDWHVDREEVFRRKQQDLEREQKPCAA